MRQLLVAVAGSAAVLLAVVAAAGQAPASRPAITRLAIIQADDARAATADQLQLLTAAATQGPAPLQALAVQALGRLERPELVATLAPLLDEAAAPVRAEAANALAQSVGTDAAAARAAREAMVRRLVGERDADVRGALADALGRLPIDSPAVAVDTEKALFEVASRTEVTHHLGKSSAGPRIIGLTLTPSREVAVPTPALIGALCGLEAFARGRARARQGLMPETIDLLKAIVVENAQSLPRVRALALLCLLPVNAVDRDLAARALDDPDFQVRRLALTSSSADLPTIQRGLKDPAWMVRYEALLRYGRRFQAAEGCEPIVNAIGARVDHQALLAIDLLGGPCRVEDHAVETLLDLAAGVGEGDWHRPAHAMVAAAKAGPERARPMLARFLFAADWRTRMYAARAAGQLGDIAALRRLAADTNDNVREVAVTELSKAAGHDADPAYLSALGTTDFQLAIAAAKALAGSSDRAAAVPALFAALSRLTALASDTSRDPRVAVLERIRELGSPEQAEQLRPCLDDRDARVASLAAEILTKWTGSTVRATPKPRPAQPFSLTDADLDRLSRSVVRFTMADGRQFEMKFLEDLAPVSSARFAALVGQGYYNGLTFHRVIPDFLVQGGSPGANEYSGGSRYWRDEPGRASQTRGTVGASTRGRDTGDGQFYINLVDTPRLDHEYSIFGEVTSGMDVVDAILEGDVIQKAELVPAKTRK
jgi:cyclophilin family peptidyl-prolyl cis-trans isomerase/HEAT repeat protein